jgi:hypothetical protein
LILLTEIMNNEVRIFNILYSFGVIVFVVLVGVIIGLRAGGILTIEGSTRDRQRVSPAGGIYYDENLDIAVFGGVPLDDEITRNDSCYAMVDEDIYVQSTRGRVRGKVIAASALALETTAHVIGGDSGSPIISVDRGCVVGYAIGAVYGRADGAFRFSFGAASMVVPDLISGICGNKEQ